MDKPVEEECRCQECASIHEEFITHFGRWPLGWSHERGQHLARSRRENEASFQAIMHPWKTDP